jgi:hypothetical protein
MRLTDNGLAWFVYALSDGEAETLFGSDSAGMLVEDARSDGGWLTTARLFPVPGSSRFALRKLHGPGRVVFRGRFEFRQAWAAVIGTPGEMYRVVTARHSRLGDQTAAMTVTGSTTVALAPGDTLALVYQRTADAAEGSTNWFMVMGETGAASTLAGRDRVQPPAVPSVPGEFALHANQPNPFSGFTTIRLALPRSEHVRLMVFDVLGRRVRTLVDQTVAAGEQAFEWDGRNESGSPSPGGVYHARVQAGGFRAQRTMVLLPR